MCPRKNMSNNPLKKTTNATPRTHPDTNQRDQQTTPNTKTPIPMRGQHQTTQTTNNATNNITKIATHDTPPNQSPTSNPTRYQHKIQQFFTTNNKTQPPILPLTQADNHITITSQRTPTTLHSNEPTGDTLPPTKDNNTIRIYFQNINGANSNQWSDWESANQYLAMNHFDIAGYAETNIPWTQQQRNTANAIARRHHQQVAMHTCTSNDHSTSNYQPGGVACITLGKWTGRITERFQDNTGMGRWTGFCLQGKDNIRISIITAYRAVKTTGASTSYMQQWRTIRNHPTTNYDNKTPEPRSQMIKDLSKEINNRKRQQHEILLLWDANESIDTKYSQLPSFLNQTGLSILHKELPQNSYNRGSHCIDYAMGTNNIRNAITTQGYMPFLSGAWNSDHRPFFLDLNATKLFRNTTTKLAPQIQRNINSNNCRQMKPFIELLRKNNDLIHSLNQQLDELQLHPPPTDIIHQTLESIDQQFTALLLQAESAAEIKNKAPWHPALHQAHLVWEYWRRKASGNATKIDTSTQLLDILQQIRPPTDIHMNDITRPTHYQLKKATKILRELRQTA